MPKFWVIFLSFEFFPWVLSYFPLSFFLDGQKSSLCYESKSYFKTLPISEMWIELVAIPAGILGLFLQPASGGEPPEVAFLS